MARPLASSSLKCSQVAQCGTRLELASSTRGASLWVSNTPTGLPDWISKVWLSSRRVSTSTILSKHSQLRAARPMPPYTTSSLGFSATSGSRLFISMRSGASVSQLLAVSVVPRAARISVSRKRLITGLLFLLGMRFWINSGGQGQQMNQPRRDLGGAAVDVLFRVEFSQVHQAQLAAVAHGLQQRFEQRQRHASRCRGADAGGFAGRQHVAIDGQIDGVATGDKGRQFGADGRQTAFPDLAVFTHQHVQLGGALEQGAGVARATDAQTGIGERPATGGALLGDLGERRAGRTGVSRVAQIEVRVEIDNADTRGGHPWDGHPWGGHPRRSSAGQMLGDTLPAAEGHFMAATQHDGQVPGIQQRADVMAETRLGAFQIAVGAQHITSVIGRALAMPGQIGQRFAHRQRTIYRANAAMVAPHAFVAGETEQGHAGLAVGTDRLNALVPARAVGFRVDAALPELHGVAISVHGYWPLCCN